MAIGTINYRSWASRGHVVENRSYERAEEYTTSPIRIAYLKSCMESQKLDRDGWNITEFEVRNEGDKLAAIFIKERTFDVVSYAMKNGHVMHEIDGIKIHGRILKDSEIIATYNERIELKAEVERLRARLQIDPGGGDAIDAAESAMDHLRHSLNDMTARRDVAQSVAENLRSVLEPFARILDDGWASALADEREIGLINSESNGKAGKYNKTVTIGALRKAARAFYGQKQAESGNLLMPEAAANAVGVTPYSAMRPFVVQAVDWALRKIAEHSEPTARDALQAIANIRTPNSVAVMEGQESAYRAVEKLFSNPPHVVAERDEGVTDSGPGSDAMRVINPDQWEREKAALNARIAHLEAAFDALEIKSGDTTDGSLWRFWSDKARQMAEKAAAAGDPCRFALGGKSLYLAYAAIGSGSNPSFEGHRALAILANDEEEAKRHAFDVLSDGNQFVRSIDIGKASKFMDDINSLAVPADAIVISGEITDAIVEAYKDGYQRKIDDIWSQSPTEDPYAGHGAIGYGIRAAIKQAAKEFTACNS